MKLFSFKKHRQLPRWVTWLLTKFISGLAWTYRVKIIDEHHVLDFVRQEDSKSVVAIWHNRLMFKAAVLPKDAVSRCSVLISASRDGEYITRIIKSFGLGVVRGSSSRGAREALYGLMHEVNANRHVILTVDGPRGPQYTVHPGVALVARHCQAPVIPLVLNAKRKIRLRSWDKMQIPLPFTKVEVIFGKPFMLDDTQDIKESCETVRQALLALTVD